MIDNTVQARAATPSSHWHADGQSDPHGAIYDCERAALTMGSLTDDELANGAFLNYDQPFDIEAIMSQRPGYHPPIVWMTAVKDRIRWLSRALEKAQAAALTAPAAVPVAWQVRRKNSTPRTVWEPCTAECYADTLATGKYLGLSNGAPCEVRALVVAPSATAPADAQIEDAAIAVFTASQGPAPMADKLGRIDAILRALLAPVVEPGAQAGREAEDAARLDWLDHSRWYVGPEYDSDEAGGIHGYDNHTGNLREAIDAARATQGDRNV